MTRMVLTASVKTIAEQAVIGTYRIRTGSDPPVRLNENVASAMVVAAATIAATTRNS